LVIFAVPLLLARQSLSRSERLDGAARRLDTQSDALRDVAATIVDERRDERLTLAAGLHDEVLPPLYQVHLLGQVLRQDLATGQLFALEDDLPGLLKAADSASESMRNLIRGLRTSALGRAGLCETLRILVEYLRQESEIDIQLSATSTDVDGAPITQLLVYQVAREAIRNAIRHSQAEAISVLLSGGGDEICLVVEDDGLGFVPGVVDKGRHFGLELMRERVELAGGVLRVDSTRGAGTRVVARVPSGSLLEPQDE
jgi:signal transduction histidine kinase